MRRLSAAEEYLHRQFLAADIPDPVREYRFHSTRRFRFDFAWPDSKVAVEVEGLTYQGGRHQRMDGYRRDIEKYNLALMEGWKVYRVASGAVYARGRGRDTGAIVEDIRRLLDSAAG